MAVVTLLRRVVLGATITVVAAIGGGPLALYWLGLYTAGGKPDAPTVLAPQEAQLAAWQRERGVGQPSITPLNPYTYIPLAGEDGPHKAGLLVAWRVASGHLLQHRRYQGMGWWHLSGAALTIWLTRNWSIEQLLTKASEARVPNES